MDSVKVNVLIISTNKVKSKFLFFISDNVWRESFLWELIEKQTIQTLLVIKTSYPYYNTLLQFGKIKENIGKVGFCWKKNNNPQIVEFSQFGGVQKNTYSVSVFITVAEVANKDSQ